MSNGPSMCTRCGSELEYGRELERYVHEGNDVAVVKVQADVCRRCGEVLLHPGMVEKLAKAEETLKRHAAGAPVGRVYDLRDDRAA
jgi:YgiT-type zinc finger domain-containing protein